MVRLERESPESQPAPESLSFHPPERKTKLMTQIEERLGGQPIEEILFHLYGEQGKSGAMTAEEVRVNTNTIWGWFRKCGIKSRSKSELATAQWEKQRAKMIEAAQKAGRTQTKRTIQRIEEQIGRSLKEYLREAKARRLSKKEVCGDLEIHDETLNRILKIEGIEWFTHSDIGTQSHWVKRKESLEAKLVEKAREEGVFSLLTEREQIVLNGRFPKEDDIPKSLTFFGRELGITRQRVEQIQNRAIEKLRSML